MDVMHVQCRIARGERHAHAHCRTATSVGRMTDPYPMWAQKQGYGPLDGRGVLTSKGQKVTLTQQTQSQSMQQAGSLTTEPTTGRNSASARVRVSSRKAHPYGSRHWQAPMARRFMSTRGSYSQQFVHLHATIIPASVQAGEGSCRPPRAGTTTAPASQALGCTPSRRLWASAGLMGGCNSTWRDCGHGWV